MFLTGAGAVACQNRSGLWLWQHEVAFSGFRHALWQRITWNYIVKNRIMTARPWNKAHSPWIRGRMVGFSVFKALSNSLSMVRKWPKAEISDPKAFSRYTGSGLQGAVEIRS